jgi:hypothetical protein
MAVTRGLAAILRDAAKWPLLRMRLEMTSQARSPGRRMYFSALHVDTPSGVGEKAP